MIRFAIYSSRKLSNVSIIAKRKVILCAKLRALNYSLQRETTAADIGVIYHIPCKISGIIKFPRSEIGFCSFAVHLYAITYERAISRNGHRTGLRIQRTCAPHEIPYNPLLPLLVESPVRRNLNGFEIFHRSLTEYLSSTTNSRSHSASREKWNDRLIRCENLRPLTQTPSTTNVKKSKLPPF